VQHTSACPAANPDSVTLHPGYDFIDLMLRNELSQGESIPHDWYRNNPITLKRAFGHRATEYTEKNQWVGKQTFNTF
jgi:hypothetical protein